MRRPKLQTKQQGFTIIELLIATAIFSVIALIATSAIVRIGQMYYKGVTVADTQDITRKVNEEITQAVQFSSAKVVDDVPAPAKPTDRQAVCIGNTRYFYSIDTPYKAPLDTAHANLGKAGLVAQRLNAGQTCACPYTNSSCGTAPQQLLGENMRLTKFDITEINSTGGTAYSVSIGVAYGDGDLLTEHDETTGAPLDDGRGADKTVCRSGISGSSFCATSRLDTIVKRRLQ